MSSNIPPGPTSSSTSAILVSASSHLAHAPPSAQAGTADEIRQLVMDYLCSCCYADSARSLAREVDAFASDAGLNGELVVAPGGSASGRPRARQGVARSRNGVVANGAAAAAAAAADHDFKDFASMEGVVATPPPFDATDDADMISDDDDNEDDDSDKDNDNDGKGETGEETDATVELSLRLSSNGTNRKTVSIDSHVTDSSTHKEPDPPEGWSSLSLGQLRAVRLRQKIRDNILAGRIQPASDLIQEHYPAVLVTSDTASTSQLARPVLNSANSRDSCRPSNFFVPTPSAASSSSASPTSSASKLSVPVIGDTFSPSALSLRPEIVSLNLQLQSFVEHIRSASAASAPSTPTTAESSPTTENAMTGSASSIASARTVSMTKAIAQSQALRARVGALAPGKERDDWERECIDVSGLMAYTDLSICPVRGYLSQKRRDVLAELVNAAILQHTKHTPMPIVALAARQATAIWATLAELKVQFPPAPRGTSSKDRSKVKTFPVFDLRTYLQESEPSAGDVTIR